jgi:hypothetical protein
MAWILVPCLVSLRDEFNRLAPDRDRGSDGSIGDGEHSQNTSDHNPDETGKTPSEDADSKNEVHAIDVDEDLRRAGWTMGRAVQIIVTRHRQGLDDRLQNVIYNERIWSRSWGWGARAYVGANDHTQHAHFGARYTTAQENDTRPWGLLEADDMAELTPANLTAIGKAAADAVWSRMLTSSSTAKRWPDSPAQTASNYLLLAAIHAKDAAGSAVLDEARDAALLEAIQAGRIDIDELAKALVDRLPAEQTQALLDALAARLAS